MRNSSDFKIHIVFLLLYNLELPSDILYYKFSGVEYFRKDGHPTCFKIPKTTMNHGF